MSFILLGILNSQAAGAVAGGGSYDLLETTVLDSDTASVSFTSLNSTYGSDYKHLQIRAVTRTDRSSTGDVLTVAFNGVSGTSYAWHKLNGGGSSVSSDGDTSEPYMETDFTQAASSTSGAFGASVTDILDAFDTSKNTTIRTFSGSNEVRLSSGLFINTAAVDSITIDQLLGSNFVTGSRFSLYGIGTPELAGA